MSSSQEISLSLDVSWLRPIWDYYKKTQFEMRSGDWPDYSDLIELCKANPHLVEIYPHNEVTDETGQPAINDIRIKPLALKLLKEKPRQVHRQATINNEKVDIRSERALMILTPPIGNLELAAGIWLKQLGTETDLRVLRAIRMNLVRLLAWRGHELSLELKDKISNLGVVCT